MLVLIKKIDKTYGGYDYVEIDTINKVYSTGSSRAHQGHGHSYKAGGEWLDIKVSTNKELKQQVEDIKRQGFKDIGNMRKYQNEKEQ